MAAVFQQHFQLNKHGGRFVNGKALDEDLRELIVLSLLKEGADVVTGKVPYGKIKQTAERCMVGSDTVAILWKRYVEDQSLEPKLRGGSVSKLGEQEVDLIQHLKTRTPSMTYADILKVLEQTAVLPSGTSKPAVGRVVVNKLGMSYKKLTRCASNKFTADNIRYCQFFVNYMSGIKAENIKFFDEAGINLQVCNPTHGHSNRGERAVEVVPAGRGTNHTLMVLCSLEGIDFAKIIPGGADTTEYLQFWADAEQFLTRSGRPMFDLNDHIILDNCPTHRYEGAEALVEFLAQRMSWLIFTPVYSPEFNIAELVFNYVKKVAKRDDIRTLANVDLYATFYGILASITPGMMYNFYRSAEYFVL